MMLLCCESKRGQQGLERWLQVQDVSQGSVQCVVESGFADEAHY